MDIWRTTLVFFRRWYLTLPVFLVSLAVSGWVYVAVPTHYVSVSVLVLTTPTSGGSLPVDQSQRSALSNPLLNFDKGLGTSAAILIQILSSPETAAKMGAPAGGTTTYQVNNGSTNPELLNSGPFVFIQADSTSPAAARNLVLGLIDQAKLKLADRQRQLEAPLSTYIALGEVVPPTTPQAQRKSKMRAVAAALAIGFVASLCAAFGSESIAEAQRARRRASASASGIVPDPQVPDKQVPDPLPAVRR
jgi:hypothetical protein